MNVKTIDIIAVTEEQIDRCSRVIDMAAMLPFYLVLSESDNLTEYKVAAIRKNGEYHLTCTCPAGLRGIPCKHRRWAMAASEDFKRLIKAQAQADARIAQQTVPAPREVLYTALHIDYSDQDDATLARVIERDQERKAEPKKPGRKVAYCQTRPTGFSLFR